MLIQVCHWPSRVQTVTTLSVIFFCSADGLLLPFFPLHPWGYFLSWEDTGNSFMQTTVGEESSCCSFTGSLSLPQTSMRRGNMHEKKKRWWKSKLLLSTPCCLNCSCQTWQNCELWWGLGAGEVSLPLFVYLSVSPSLFFLPLWTEARVLLGLLYCAGGKLPTRASLIEHWKQEFYKGADLLFITSYSNLSLPHSSVLHWLTVARSNFLSRSFLKLSLCCVHPVLLCWPDHPSSRSLTPLPPIVCVRNHWWLLCQYRK